MQVRGSAKALQKAKQIGLAAEKAEKDVDSAAKKIELTTNDMLAMGLNVASVFTLTRFAVKDLAEIARGEGGIGDILSLMTATLILAFRLRQMYLEIVGLQMTSNFLSSIPLGPMGIIAGLGLGALAVGIADVASDGARSGRNRKDQSFTRYRELAWRTRVG